MLNRRILVIGSQCAPFGPLPFLPQAAIDLYEVMTDPELGGCTPALDEGGIKHDLTLAETKSAIENALREASDSNDLLFLALIGHGHQPDIGNDFFFLPCDEGSSRCPRLVNM